MHRPPLAALGAAIALVLVGCASQPRYTVPAPYEALDCALEEALSLGYERLEGTVEGREVLVGKRRAKPINRQDPRPERELGDIVFEDLRDVPWESRLRLHHGAGRLRVDVLSQPEESRDVGEVGEATADAQRLIATCTW